MAWKIKCGLKIILTSRFVFELQCVLSAACWIEPYGVMNFVKTIISDTTKKPATRYGEFYSV